MADTAQILLVDDESNFLDFTRTYLNREEEEFSLITETTAQAGLERIASNRIDCVVSDYHMPEMDGIEFLEEVRSENPQLPFILFTGEGDNEIQEEATAKGATAFLNKNPIPDQYVTLSNQIRESVGLAVTPPPPCTGAKKRTRTCRYRPNFRHFSVNLLRPLLAVGFRHYAVPRESA